MLTLINQVGHTHKHDFDIYKKIYIYMLVEFILENTPENDTCYVCA